MGFVQFPKNCHEFENVNVCAETVNVRAQTVNVGTRMWVLKPIWVLSQNPHLGSRGYYSPVILVVSRKVQKTTYRGVMDVVHSIFTLFPKFLR